MGGRTQAWMFGILVLGGLPWVQSVSAQDPGELSDEDVWLLRFQTLEFLLDSTSTQRDDGSLPTVWLLPPYELDPETDEHVLRPYSDAEKARLEETFPLLRVTDSTSRELFECPPGRTVRMPISGCPIRDEGIMLRIGIPHMDGDTAVVSRSITESSPDGERSWSFSRELEFVRSDGGWRFVGTRGWSIT